MHELGMLLFNQIYKEPNFPPSLQKYTTIRHNSTDLSNSAPKNTSIMLFNFKATVIALAISVTITQAAPVPEPVPVPAPQLGGTACFGSAAVGCGLTYVREADPEPEPAPAPTPQFTPGDPCFGSAAVGCGIN